MALNTEQQKAVDIIEGPLLVIAGPGTGKTQLLSERVANILIKTGVLPGSILCLTYTENAAQNMRERLKDRLGQSAYHVAIHTFHSFGSTIINQYPDYFSHRLMLQPIDGLGKHQIIFDVLESLDHNNPLTTKLNNEYIYIKNIIDNIGWLKQNALSAGELNQLLKANLKSLELINPIIKEAFTDRTSNKQLLKYRKLLDRLAELQDPVIYGFMGYSSLCYNQLLKAIEETDTSKHNLPKITEWRNQWCEKNANGDFVLKDSGLKIKKMLALQNIYQQYEQLLTARGLYDFEDMIIETVHALENNQELLYNLQERYLYVLVDEFQDTNKAQFRLLEALGNNPVNEHKPNIMAVGDDDQAIYSFQGAQASNMSMFLELYPKAKVLSLQDNYRSTQNILNLSQKIAEQIEDRITIKNQKIDRQLIAKNDLGGELTHFEFISELAQYDFLSQKIKQLIKAGSAPKDIAVLAPKHKYLQRIMPYLGEAKIPVAYEHREDILQSPLIIMISTMSRLIVAIASNDQAKIDVFLPEILGYEFWAINLESILKLSLTCYDQRQHWLEVALKSTDPKVKKLVEWFLSLAKVSQTEPLEYLLDRLIGNMLEANDDEFDDLLLPQSKNIKQFISPFKQYYFNEQNFNKTTASYLTILGQLSTLRDKLRIYKANQTIFISDLIEYIDLHLIAKEKIVDNNPHTQTTNAVQVMTAHSAKGLEFQTVFVINVQEDVWSPTNNNQNKISLPKNLKIKPAGDSPNDKLRLLYVSLTRAKKNLYLTSYQYKLDNKKALPLSYLLSDKSSYIDKQLEPIVSDQPAKDKSQEILTTDWAYRFKNVIADKPSLFEPILKNYLLSVTHLNNFLDVTKDGPNFFLKHNLLRFPEAMSPSGAYGDAIHKTLQWTHIELKKLGQPPKITDITQYFISTLYLKHLSDSDFKRLKQRGQQTLNKYFEEKPDSLKATDILERNFAHEGVNIDGAILSGKIDKIELLSDNLCQVIDFKTGKPADNWYAKNEFTKIKLHKYKQQLNFYKLLIENSASYSHKLKVKNGLIEFIESDEENTLAQPLILEYQEQELENIKSLILAVWRCIKNLNFPDTSSYQRNVDGIQAFEQDLINHKFD